MNSIHNSIVPGPNLALNALIERAVLAYPRFGTELDSARRPGFLSKKNVQWAPSAGNYFNLYQARENMQPAHRATKQATGAKRGKTGNRCQARENMSLEPVSSAEKPLTPNHSYMALLYLSYEKRDRFKQRFLVLESAFP